MPNWCENEITIYPNENMNACSIMGKLNKCITTEQTVDFNQVIPVPHELLIEENNMMVDEEDMLDLKERVNFKREDQDLLYSMFPTKEYLINRYKYDSAYDWRCNNWETKWDGTDLVFHEVTNERVTLFFMTAWSAPQPIIDRWKKWFSGNRFIQYAYEPGNNVCWMKDDEYEVIVDLEGDVLTPEEYEVYHYLDAATAEDHWGFDYSDSKYYRKEEDEDE